MLFSTPLVLANDDETNINLETVIKIVIMAIVLIFAFKYLLQSAIGSYPFLLIPLMLLLSYILYKIL